MVIDGEFSPKISLSSVFWISLLVCGRDFSFLHLFLEIVLFFLFGALSFALFSFLSFEFPNHYFLLSLSRASLYFKLKFVFTAWDLSYLIIS